MKSKLLTLAFTACAATGALAGPVVSMPAGPLYFKFDNREQIAINGTNTGYANETNWGVLVVSSMDTGAVTGTNTIEDISSIPSFFTNAGGAGAQITGIFYGINATTSALNTFPSTGGFLDLYWRDLSIYSPTDIALSTAAVRTSQSTATGYTEGTFLVRIAFAPGIINDPNVTIAGSVVPTPGTGFVGTSTAYGNVVVGATVGGNTGAYETALNSDFFTTAFGTRDLRFRNLYEELGTWTNGPNLLGARSTDPATAFVVPEPASLALVGAALLGLAVTSRRRQA